MGETVDILAIAAHPDDVEQTCGGTLMAMAEKGYRTGVLDLTAGEMGTRGTPARRLEEAAEAAKVLSLTRRENAGLPDARLENTLEARVNVAGWIRDFHPRIVILPYWEARHPDHYRASEIGVEACFFAGLKKLELEGEPHRPSKVLYASIYADVRPSFVVDISAQWDRREKSLFCYRSQYGAQGQGDKLFPEQRAISERLAAAARYYGLMIDAVYGEPFVVKEMMRVDDIATMGVRSM